MKLFLYFIIFLAWPYHSQSKVIKISDLPWLTKLTENKVKEFNICGTPEIQLTKKSLTDHFMLGPKQSGFLFSNILSYQQYFKMLSEKI